MSTTEVLPTTSSPTQGERIVAAEVDEPVLAGYMAEFDNVDAVLSAATRVRDAGFRIWDVHSPFPIHGIDEAMGIRPTLLPWLVAIGGLAGLLGGLLMQWWMNAKNYAYFVSGKPLFSLPAFIPVIFECTIAGAAFTAVFGMLILNRLPMLYNPVFKSERFRRVTNDRFFLVINAADPSFDEQKTMDLLSSLNPSAIERLED